MSHQPHINHYRLRLVAPASEKPCSVCYRPTASVLMSKDSKDWFYVCAAHLQPGFATPHVDEAAEAAKAKQAQIDKAKAEYEARQKAKQEKRAADDKDKDKSDDKDKKKAGWFDMFTGASEPAKATPETPTSSTTATPAATPTAQKEWILHRTVYNHRCELKLKAVQEKARADQWSKLSFPSAPNAPLSKP